MIMIMVINDNDKKRLEKALVFKERKPSPAEMVTIFPLFYIYS